MSKVSNLSRLTKLMTDTDAIFNTGHAMIRLSALLALLATPVFADGDHTPIGDAIKDVPLFDAHIHYKEPAWGAYPVQNIIELMDKSGVAMGLVSSTPDDGTIMLWDYAPNRIVPELRPYHGDAGSSNWTKTPDMTAYLAQRLADYPHTGIGEFHIHSLDTSDAPLFREIIAMARKDDLFLHVHSGPEPIRWLYSLDPDVKIIWAHAGLGERPETIYALMDDHPTLTADTSLREFAINDGPDGKLNPEWEKIVLDFQDRLMVGSDTWVNGQWDRYESIMASNRTWLSKLPRNVAEKIAYKNAERLFGRKISMDQIGTR